MGKPIDVSGQVFGRLTAVSVHEKARRVTWSCRCECGNTTLATTAQLRYGHKQSCGCLQKDAAANSCVARSTHGQKGTRLYNIWHGMKQRCEYPKNIGYARYGGRGIRVCQEWSLAFQPFMDWALSHGYSDELSIDRKDSDGNYEPDNCKWSNSVEQANNRCSSREILIDGERITAADLSKASGINVTTIMYRLNRGSQGRELIRPVVK